MIPIIDTKSEVNSSVNAHSVEKSFHSFQPIQIKGYNSNVAASESYQSNWMKMQISPDSSRHRMISDNSKYSAQFNTVHTDSKQQLLMNNVRFLTIGEGQSMLVNSKVIPEVKQIKGKTMQLSNKKQY